MRYANLTIAALTAIVLQTTASAQGSMPTHGHPGGSGGHNHPGGPHLHVNDRWRECSFQLHPSLTQKAWRQFTEEAGLVVYFRPLADARPMGRGKFEVAALQWGTGIDASDAAWNDTFVHPDSTHWLFEGSALKFPGLTMRAGVTDRTDVGAYVTRSPGANYGFFGGQVQHSFAGDANDSWAAAARASFVSMYGPDDLDFTVYGVDMVASRKLAMTRWATVSPYAGVSTYLATSQEKSSVVNLDNERVLGAQGMIGAAMDVSFARLGVEYSIAKVPTLSFKVGIGR
jgi:hypothetical protein